MSAQDAAPPQAGGGAGGGGMPVFGPATDDKTTHVEAAMSVCFAAAAIAVSLRFLTRCMLTSVRVWLDDFLILASLVVDIGFLVCTVLLIDNGMGRHVDLTDLNATTNFLKTYIPAACFYATTISLTKLSVLAFYWRIFNSDDKIRLPIYIFSGIVICWNIAVVLVSIFQCQPVAYWWNRSIPGGVCIDKFAFLLGNSVPNIATDFAILLLPLPFIWKLHQSKGRRVALAGVFLLAGFVCVITIIRLVIQVRTDFESPDLTWTISDFVMWTNIETNLAIVCACLPSLRPILSFIRTGRFDSHKRASGTAAEYSSSGPGASNHRHSHHHYHHHSTSKSIITGPIQRPTSTFETSKQRFSAMFRSATSNTSDSQGSQNDFDEYSLVDGDSKGVGIRAQMEERDAFSGNARLGGSGRVVSGVWSGSRPESGIQVITEYQVEIER